jgi:uncharacterized protein (TIGR02145 family)
MKRKISVLLVLLFILSDLGAQNIECIGNTIILPLDGYKEGNIEWQFSTNGQDWSNIDEGNTPELNYIITQTGYFRARVVYGNCTYYSDATYIEAYPVPSTAQAGNDKNSVTGSVTLEANTPVDGTGTWTVVSGIGGSFTNSHIGNTTFTGTPGNRYTLRWTISTQCESNYDDVNIWLIDTSPVVYFGDVYHTVVIGDQLWMVENLKTIKYNDNTDIPLVENDTTWAMQTSPAYCWYNNDETTYKDTYGALYNGYTVQNDKLCPVSWHVPSLNDWTTLIDLLGGHDVAGGKLKETGTTHWLAPNTGATNESGFTALPGGHRHEINLFTQLGQYGFWWSNTLYDEDNNTWFWFVGNSSPSLLLTHDDNLNGFSVRCIKDE